MAGKKAKPRKYFKLAETQLICPKGYRSAYGSSEEKKQEMIVHARIALSEHKQRLPIGVHLKNLSVNMVIGLKLKWLSYGGKRLVLEQFREDSRKLVSQEKKELWL
jgi:hypothetical protein